MLISWLTVFADVPGHQVDAATDFWVRVTATSPSSPRGDREEFIPLSVDDEEPYVWVQRLEHPEGTPGWHLDLSVNHLAGAVRTATRLGAATTGRGNDLVALTTPAGQPFCLVKGHGERQLAAPRQWPGGHASLVDQLCLDLPAAVYDEESGFWESLTGWERRGGTLSEFERLGPPRHIPLRILLQRLGADDLGPPRAHLDFACDDVRAEQQRHEALGATTTRVHEHWTVMRDPIGLTYCLTDREPAG